MKLYSKIGKEVVSAIKRGGPNPVSNTALAAVLEKAKELDVPKDILERNIKKAFETGQETYIEKIYEQVSEADKNQLLWIVLDAGAEDVVEPPVYEDGTEEDVSESDFKIISSSESYSAILSKLHEEGINFETDGGFELIPITAIEVDDEAMDLNKELIAKLLDLDDVDAVYTDQK